MVRFNSAKTLISLPFKHHGRAPRLRERRKLSVRQWMYRLFSMSHPTDLGTRPTQFPLCRSRNWRSRLLLGGSESGFSTYSCEMALATSHSAPRGATSASSIPCPVEMRLFFLWCPGLGMASSAVELQSRQSTHTASEQFRRGYCRALRSNSVATRTTHQAETSSSTY